MATNEVDWAGAADAQVFVFPIERFGPSHPPLFFVHAYQMQRIDNSHVAAAPGTLACPSSGARSHSLS